MIKDMLPFLGTIISSILATIGAIKVANVGKKSTKFSVEQDGTFKLIDQLQKEINNLRTEVHELDEKQQSSDRFIHSAVTFIDRIGLWLEAGMPNSWSVVPPESMRSFIDMDVWERIKNQTK